MLARMNPRAKFDNGTRKLDATRSWSTNLLVCHGSLQTGVGHQKDLWSELIQGGNHQARE